MSEAIRICRECRQVLTETEIEHYESRCEQCEREWHEAITAWRHAEPNPEFDALYAGPEETKH